VCENIAMEYKLSVGVRISTWGDFSTTFLNPRIERMLTQSATRPTPIEVLRARVDHTQWAHDVFDLVNTSLANDLRASTMQPELIARIWSAVRRLDGFYYAYRTRMFMRNAIDGASLALLMWDIRMRLLVFLHEWHLPLTPNSSSTERQVRLHSAADFPWVLQNRLVVAEGPIWNYSTSTLLDALRVLEVRRYCLFWNESPEIKAEFSQYLDLLEAVVAMRTVCVGTPETHDSAIFCTLTAEADVMATNVAWQMETEAMFAPVRAEMRIRRKLQEGDATQRCRRIVPWWPCDPNTEECAGGDTGADDSPVRCPAHRWRRWLTAQGDDSKVRDDSFWRLVAKQICDWELRPSDPQRALRLGHKAVTLRGEAGAMKSVEKELNGEVFAPTRNWQRILPEARTSQVAQFLFTDMLERAENRSVSRWLNPTTAIATHYGTAVRLILVDLLFGAEGAIHLAWSTLCFIRAGNMQYRRGWLSAVVHPIVLELCSGSEYAVFLENVIYPCATFEDAVVLWSVLLWHSTGGRCVIDCGNGAVHDVRNVLAQFMKSPPQMPEFYKSSFAQIE